MSKRQILDEFKANGIKFALEVHPGEIAFAYYSTEKLLKKFADRPEFGLKDVYKRQE